MVLFGSSLNLFVRYLILANVLSTFKMDAVDS